MDDKFNDSIEAHQAIMIDKKSGNNLFRDAIRSEVLDNLIKNTGSLKPISQEQLQKLEDYITIPSTVKCKRKLKPDGSYDKHKARTAARGDHLVRKLIKLGMDQPDTFSPMIRTLTFLLVLQIAIFKGLKYATQDIKYAYLNADIPKSDVPIITKLHPQVAEMCGLNPNQLYQIMKCLYGYLSPESSGTKTILATSLRKDTHNLNTTRVSSIESMNTRQHIYVYSLTTHSYS